MATINSTAGLVPDYLSTDFDTYVERMISVLKSTEQFKDYNYEGSNIRMILEHFAYMSEINTFYQNKIAQNLYEDTVDVYENAHRIVSMKGYNPRGYVAATGTVTVSVPMEDDSGGQNFYAGDTLMVPAFSRCFASTDSGLVEYVTVSSLTVKVPDDFSSQLDSLYQNTGVNGTAAFSFDVPVVQGTRESLTYKASTMIDNKIVLPFANYDHGSIDDDDASTCDLLVDENPWTRVSNFQEKITGLDTSSTDQVYMLKYDKYKRYVIEFASFRSTPSELAEVTIGILMTLGSSGNVGANLITTFDSVLSAGFVRNVTRTADISVELLTVTNALATTGGADPQATTDILGSGTAAMNSQQRLVTASDYEDFLTGRADVVAANAWGEREITRTGDTREYNKVHISVIPPTFDSSTVSADTFEWTVNSVTESLERPIGYGDDYSASLLTYMEPRKMLNAIEVLDLPEVIYFALRLGLKIKRLYSFTDVAESVKEKVAYYFDRNNRSFAEKISFTTLHNYIFDLSVTKTGSDWSPIKGLDNLVFRSISVSSDAISQDKIDYYSGEGIDVTQGSNIYPPNSINDFPMYTSLDYLDSVENRLKVIKLGHNQFPMISINQCVFEEETE